MLTQTGHSPASPPPEHDGRPARSPSRSPRPTPRPPRRRGHRAVVGRRVVRRRRPRRRRRARPPAGTGRSAYGSGPAGPRPARRARRRSGRRSSARAARRTRPASAGRSPQCSRSCSATRVAVGIGGPQLRVAVLRRHRRPPLARAAYGLAAGAASAHRGERRQLALAPVEGGQHPAGRRRSR